MPAIKDGAVWTITAVTAAAVAAGVQIVLPQPYMDEIFHVPQAQAYCAGKLTVWDDKITTPAGLYLLAWLVARVPWVVCSTLLLRGLNVVAGMLMLSVLRALLMQVRGKHVSLGEPAIVALFPVSYFFWFLFYTDTWSTLLVLLCYVRALQGRTWQSALAGALATLFRQTNVVWAAFAMGAAMLSQLHMVEPKDATFVRPSSSAGAGAGVRDVGSRIVTLVQLALRHLGLLVDVALPYIPLFATFAVFVVYNGGIVLGDKANHVATVHVPQLLYLVVFATVFSAPVLLSPVTVWAFVRMAWRQLTSPWRALRLLALATALAAVVHYLTYEHAFLLSDNRHYTFYIWKNLFRRHDLLKYAYLPVYWFCGWHLWRSLVSEQNLLLSLGMVVATAMVLVPSPLLELRYFIVPYLLLRTHIREPGTGRLFLELVLYVAVNALSLWLFVAKPFASGGAIQHFMW